MKLISNSLVSGYGDGKFGPDDEDNVTREQLAAIIYRYQGFSSKVPADKHAVWFYFMLLR